MNTETLTNEYLSKFFKNNFEMTNYAIQVARQIVRSGKELELDETLAEITKIKVEEQAEKVA